MNRKKLGASFAAGAAALTLMAGAMPLSASAEWRQIGYLGDLNRDAAVNVADLVTMSKHLLGQQALTTDNFYRMQDIIGSENPYFDFFELQYIGPLMLKNDVECIDIFRKNFEGRKDLLKTTEEYCKSTGIQLNLHEL